MNAPAILTLDLTTLDANGPYQQRRTRASAEADAGDAQQAAPADGFNTCEGCDEPEDCRAAGKCWAESEEGGDG